MGTHKTLLSLFLRCANPDCRRKLRRKIGGRAATLSNFGNFRLTGAWDGRLLALFGNPDCHAVEEQDAEHDAVLYGLAAIGLHQPGVMHHCQDSCEIDEAVQSLPVFAAEETNR